MLKITKSIFLPEEEIQFTFMRASGPGGQNVNKVATAVLLRFNVEQSSLPQPVRDRVKIELGNRLTTEGDLLIKASSFRTQERNKQDALKRLLAILQRAAIPPKKRKKTKPSKKAKERRLAEKKRHGKTKALRSEKINRTT